MVNGLLLCSLDIFEVNKPTQAPHKSNPSSVPRGVVDSYSTLVHVGGGNRCGGVCPVEWCYNTRSLVYLSHGGR